MRKFEGDIVEEGTYKLCRPSLEGGWSSAKNSAALTAVLSKPIFMVFGFLVTGCLYLQETKIQESVA